MVLIPLWSKDETKIFEDFRNKCIRCRKPAKVLHEIIPKSRNPKNWDEPTNRVPLCVECHNWVHYNGAGKVANELEQWRVIRLGQYRTDS